MADPRPTGNLVIVDDNPASVTILSDVLKMSEHQVRVYPSGRDLLANVHHDNPDLILLDVAMPEMDGYEVCEHLKTDPRTAPIPVIFLSALDELKGKLRAFEVGGVDYITKPFRVDEVRVRVENQLLLAHQNRQITLLNQLKDTMMRTVSHELKNPIGNILGYSYLLQNDAADIETTRRNAQQIYREAERMQQLVMRFLDLARIEEGISLKWEKLQAEALLNSLRDRFANDITAHQHTFYIELPEGDFTFMADATYFTQIMVNLVSNAIKYTPNGGRITVRATPSADAIVFEVCDNGYGIPEEALPHLFERFYRVEDRTRSPVEGTGLGLSIVQALVQQHGGQIDVKSVIDQGTRFIVSLPISSPNF